VPIPPKSIEVGRCYLDAQHRVLHVTHVTPDGRVRFKHREAYFTKDHAWWVGMLSLPDFASAAVRQVPCDWTPETDEL
jgi:hypothetical protein